MEYLVESGIVKYKLNEGLPKNPICPLDLGRKERQLRNIDLLMTYIIIGIGFIISFGIFVGELIFNWFVNRKMNVPTLEAAEKQTNYGKNIVGFNANYAFGKTGYLGGEDLSFPPPPPYNALFKPAVVRTTNSEKRIVNGREYWVVKSEGGETRLVPVRSPSALIYQFTN